MGRVVERLADRAPAPSPGPSPATPSARTQPARPEPRPALRCRAIETGDLAAVTDLLAVGFPERPREYWRTGFARQDARALPDGLPRYGYALESAGRLVGVLLTLYARDAAGHLRCNLSSWYVEPRFRAMAALLDGFAMRDRSVTYLNLSPAPHTWAMHQARGFRRLSGGQFLALPALSRRRSGQEVVRFTEALAAELPPEEARAARDHAAYGCLSLVCREAGRSRLVVLQLRRVGLAPGRRPIGPRLAHLVLGPAGDDLPGWLGALGRHLLLRHGVLGLALDADGPPPGAVGRHFPGRGTKFVRGPHPPALGDLTYTERVIFGP